MLEEEFIYIFGDLDFYIFLYEDLLIRIGEVIKFDGIVE